ncbi:MAG: N-acetylmuramoyl-L-alanine amidase [Candidatus Kapabacteria bacterium]|jgi:N-acetylmuramoyl-L-alanine amidase|nr:N-acetylmuramoyl-L-alanine amidase [Candidatus Kapabacteria bacterium]
MKSKIFKFNIQHFGQKQVTALRLLLYVSIAVFISFYKVSAENEFVTCKAKNGDGISNILIRYGLHASGYNLDFFKINNEKYIGKNNSIYIGREYVLPIKIYKYNGTSIRTTLGIDDYDYAKKIQNYNLKMQRKGLKKGDYRRSMELWVPVELVTTNSPSDKIQKKIKAINKNIVEPLFGENYKNVEIIDNSLSDCIFYIVSGHGGIDPGAVGFKDGVELHEDEYAYDVSLRLARKLIEHGAEVYVIVQDPNDGIRDEKYLKNSFDEFHYGNVAIPTQQIERLAQRTNIINNLYKSNSSKGLKQYCIETHVDSRYTGKKVDIFFYHHYSSSAGKTMAENLKKTIKQKYDKAQPGRGYEGSVSSRNLYMIRNVIPVCVFIEIGNIQNPRDQIRIIEPNNRQAIANWLTDGIILTITGK